jgi:DUF1365 family protein
VSTPKGKSSDPALSSAYYVGTLTHLRLGPGPKNRFTRKIALSLIYLDELEALEASSRMFSASRSAVLHFRRKDFLAPEIASLEEAVLSTLSDGGHPAPAARVAVLANLRTLGWQFNPLSIYYAFDSESRCTSVVAEVENTPWHERHAYVVGPPGEHHLAKKLHVSPFLPMDLTYRFEYNEPGESLRVRLDAYAGEDRMFSALFQGQRQSLDGHGMLRLLLRYPLSAQRVTSGIYAHAARLALKRAPFFRHPNKQPEALTQGISNNHD